MSTTNQLTKHEKLARIKVLYDEAGTEVPSWEDLKKGNYNVNFDSVKEATKVIMDMPEPTTSSSSSSSSGPSYAGLEAFSGAKAPARTGLRVPPNPFEELYTTLSDGDPLREYLLNFVAIPFDKPQLQQLYDAMKMFFRDSSFTFTIRPEITADDVANSKALKGVEEICSIRFMAEFHSHVNCVSRATSKGVYYTIDDKEYLFHRGIPTSQAAATAMSQLVSAKDQTRYVFPCRKDDNKVLGQFFRHLEARKSSDPITMYAVLHAPTIDRAISSDCQKLWVRTVRSLISTEASVHVKMINAIQKALALDPLYEKLRALAIHALNAYGSNLKAKYAERVPKTAGEFRLTVREIDDLKIARNRGVGDQIWHRLMNPLYACNWDAHDAQMYRALRVSGTVRDSKYPTLLVGGDDVNFRRFRVFEQVHHVKLGGPVVEMPDEYDQVFFSGYTKSTKPSSTAGRSDLISILDILRPLIKPKTRVFVRFNAMRLDPPGVAQESAFNDYKFVKCVKSGGMHTPECILVFDYVKDGSSASAPLYTALTWLLGVALSASRYMSHMVKYGVLDAPPEVGRIAFQLKQTDPGTSLTAGHKLFYAWDDSDITMPAPAGIIKELDSGKPDVAVLDDDMAYLVDDDNSEKSEAVSSSSSFSSLPPPVETRREDFAEARSFIRSLPAEEKPYTLESDSFFEEQ